ncbi:MAG: ATP-binding cassette domain-containing protein [Anaerolineae bacterium]|nr:ATP-binding cassette domain-containing protein [Anaerolineae bacterium]
MSAIELHDLSYTYLEGTAMAAPALREVSLRVEEGEIVALVGETGAGKSTLLQICRGLYRPARPGQALVLGVDTHNPRALGALRLRVGLLLQRSEAQLIERFVGDDVAFGPRQAGLSHSEVRERVRWAMESVGLGFEEFKDRRTFNLSGGEKRKVALAGVLASRPELILLDEPTAGLDPESRRAVLDLIERLRQEGSTFLVASTGVEDVPAIADRLVVLSDGRVEGDVQAPEVWRHAGLFRRHSLELPEVGRILELLAAAGHELSPNSLKPDSVAREICRILPTCAT